MPRSAVVIGASSGIGAAVAVELARRGFAVGIAARRVESLHDVAARHPGITAVGHVDLHDVAGSQAAVDGLIAQIGGADVIVIAAGTGSENPALEWEPEADTIAVNVTGFAAMATLAMRHFVDRGRGHLVGISSIAATEIVEAIESRRAHAYVTKRWRVVAAALRLLPDWLYNRM